MGGSAQFDEVEIRAAEQALVSALESSDPTAWVFEYTEDALFASGGDHVVEGREALLDMARAMGPLSSVRIEPLRTEGHGPLATVWCKGSWISAGQSDGEVQVRGVIVWRKCDDGRWRVALEHLS
jgi:ketosteroid isomerase-like protein